MNTRIEDLNYGPSIYVARRYTREEPTECPRPIKDFWGVRLFKSGKRMYVAKLSSQSNAINEVFTYELSRKLGMSIVPGTARVSACRTVQEFIPWGATDLHPAMTRERILHTKQGRDWALLDYLLGQDDRHAYNFLTRNAPRRWLALIDNALIFGHHVWEHYPFCMFDEMTMVPLHPKTKRQFKALLELLGFPDWNLVRATACSLPWLATIRNTGLRQLFSACNQVVENNYGVVIPAGRKFERNEAQ